MATYTKKLKSIVVHSLLNDETQAFPLEDTATDNAASRALADFLAYRDMVAKVEMDGTMATVTIPYHAVQYIEVNESEVVISSADPYGCKETEKVYAIKLCDEGVAPYCYCSDSPLKPITGDDMSAIAEELGCGDGATVECMSQIQVTYDGETFTLNPNTWAWEYASLTYGFDQVTGKWQLSSRQE